MLPPLPDAPPLADFLAPSMPPLGAGPLGGGAAMDLDGGAHLLAPLAHWEGNSLGTQLEVLFGAWEKGDLHLM
jgi:hypothetical protein